MQEIHEIQSVTSQAIASGSEASEHALVKSYQAVYYILIAVGPVIIMKMIIGRVPEPCTCLLKHVYYVNKSLPL